MLSLNIQGNLKKLGWDKIPEILVDDLLEICIDAAFLTAYNRAPVKTGAFRDAITKHINKNKHYGWIVVSGEEIPYNMLIEYGSRHRFAHPVFRPAAKSAANKLRSVLRKAVKEAAIKAKGI